MNNSIYVIRDAAVVSEPNVREVGGKEIVTLRVAVNPIGEKAKERYETMFVDVTYGGGLAERAKTVTKGARISASGSLGIRRWQDKEGNDRLSYEIPFAYDLVYWAPKEEAAPAAEPPKAKAASKRKNSFDL